MRCDSQVIGALMHYFGAPASPDKLKDYQEHHAATYHFPDAFAGSNVRLREVMSNLILRSPQVWQTTIGLPFQQIEGTTVEWGKSRCLERDRTGHEQGVAVLTFPPARFGRRDSLRCSSSAACAGTSRCVLNHLRFLASHTANAPM